MKKEEKMTLTVPIKELKLHPGSSITINNIKWQDFETILNELGENRRVRINYYKNKLEIMSPLAIHERPHRIIADIVKVILDQQERDWEDFGSTTFKRPEIAGVEPDTCLYIENAALVQGCTQMDLDIYPPPDLAIESDVPSKTTLDIYGAIGVPEVWIYSQKQLQIFTFQQGDYQLTENSLIFPSLPLKNMIPDLVQEAIQKGTSKMLRKLRLELNK
jgi:Uma2 family endonuclease